VIDILREENRAIRADLGVPHHVECRMVGLMSIHLDNRLPAVLLDEPDLVDFGTSEFLFARLSEVELPDRKGVKLLVSWGSSRVRKFGGLRG
jgi:hypothetical protein